MSGFATQRSRRVYEGKLSSVRIDTVGAPGGDQFDREVVEHVDAVAVVPLTPAGEVVLVRQYRHPVGELLLEIPAGICDVDDEPGQVTAARELAEETALAAEGLVRLTTVYNSAGWSDETTVLYLGTGVHPADRPEGFELEHEEAAMQVVTMPLDEAVAHVHDGSIKDSKTVIGLLLAATR